jgi:hypothetical protein
MYHCRRSISNRFSNDDRLTDLNFADNDGPVSMVRHSHNFQNAPPSPDSLTPPPPTFIRRACRRVSGREPPFDRAPSTGGT